MEEQHATTGASRGGRGRGFAALDGPARREMSSRGGRASHALGKAHRFTAEEASAAGKKGWGAAARRRRDERLAARSEGGRQG